MLLCRLAGQTSFFTPILHQVHVASDVTERGKHLFFAVVPSGMENLSGSLA